MADRDLRRMEKLNKIFIESDPDFKSCPNAACFREGLRVELRGVGTNSAGCVSPHTQAPTAPTILETERTQPTADTRLTAFQLILCKTP